MGIVPLSGIGQLQSAAPTLKQNQSKVFFQLLQKFRKCRLADIELPRCMGKISAFYNSGKYSNSLKSI